MRRIVLIFVLTVTALFAGAMSAAFATPSASVPGTSAPTPPGTAPPSSTPPGSTPPGTPGAGSAAAVPGGGLTAAQAASLVRGQGYTPLGVSGYEPGFALSVIVGRLSTSVDGHPQQAFFFHRGRYVGTGTTPSAGVRWVWSTSDVVALQYDLYRPGDPMCCPSAGAAAVRFGWDGSGVVPLDPIPSSDWSAPLSRR
ncbi:LppP/LprE family lipoprotein [Parafrankia elaeagni]|uniref:LppP/LprE family lipoprotein n=1 Tax=Parafrankia elaeagni TaxID=222534 RepID=UPI000477E548|nr:LppP/LprE family lipoprotein [Parafrankia elaeagni]